MSTGKQQQITIAAIAACRAAREYDSAIQQCGNDPERMASFCTAAGTNLDSLYARWQSLTVEALRLAGER